jgi:hypothetical protein
MLVAGSIYYIMSWTGLLEGEPPGFNPSEGLLPTGWLEAFKFQWFTAMGDAAHYLPIVIPFALATVVGGIDCTESAAAVGDTYDTRHVIGVEGVATLLAAVCGGVIQTTPYIGHPAYKAMGGRSAYTLATALFVGGAGVLGYFGYLLRRDPQGSDLSHPDLHWLGDHGAEFSCYAQTTLCRVLAGRRFKTNRRLDKFWRSDEASFFTTQSTWQCYSLLVRSRKVSGGLLDARS